MASSRRLGRFTLVGVFIVGASLGPRADAARGAEDGDRPYWRTNLFKRVLTDQKFLVTRWWPREFKDPAFASTLVAGVALALQSGGREGEGLEVHWEGSISGSASPGVQRASHGFTKLGNGATVAAILGVTFLSARRGHDDRLAEASSLASESLLDAGIWIVVIKAATARVRPSQDGGGEFFQYGKAQNGSFPSGHAMGAFSVAAVFAESYRDKRWVPWLSYGLATVVGASRLALGRHFPGDVIVGAVLGASIGRGVVARATEETPSVPGTFGPAVGPDGHGVGVGWTYTWN